MTLPYQSFGPVFGGTGTGLSVARHRVETGAGTALMRAHVGVAADAGGAFLAVDKRTGVGPLGALPTPTLGGHVKRHAGGREARQQARQVRRVRQRLRLPRYGKRGKR